jgi:hypothetical protein
VQVATDESITSNKVERTGKRQQTYSVPPNRSRASRGLHARSSAPDELAKQGIAPDELAK